MPTLTDDDQKSAIDKKIEAGHGAYTSAGLDQLESFANDPANHDNPSDVSSLGKAESTPNKGSMNYTGNGGNAIDKPRLQKAVGFAKKRGGIIGLISIFGLGGGILAGFFGPASLLINLTENFSLSNDSSSTVMERRLMKVFNNATKDSSSVCASTKKSMKCKMGKISNKALRSLNKKGVTALFDDGSGNRTRYDGKKMGYPDKNPTHYEFDTGNGKTKVVAAKDLNGFLSQKENRKLAAKIMGRKGAFNMRVKAWAGKHITAKLFKKFGINRNGGVANGGKKKMTVVERRAAARASTLKPSDGTSRESAVERATKKSMGKVKRAGKAGVGYLIAVASCVAIKVPSIVAAGVAAIQLAQLMPIAMDLVMSPGHKAKASGVDTENSISQEDMDAIGTELTNKTKNSNGKMTSALDSKYLLAAMGVNKNKMPVSTDFAPGYAILTSDVVKASRDVNAALEPACNFIMSPAAMYSAMAIDMAVTVASSATIIGGVIKIVASWLIAEIAKAVTEDIVKDLAGKIFDAVAKNDLIPKAEGEQLGDVIGHSAAAIFASASMARHLPVMTQSDLIAFNTIQQENESFQREMDIASLSPFDTSSRYTFLGSIVYNMRTAMIVNGNYNVNIASTFANIMSLPSILSPSSAGAVTGLTSEYCGYSKDYNLNADDIANSPAVNMVGLPCSGITPLQASMSTEAAITYLQDEGWICNPEKEDCPDISDDATIDQLLPDSGGDEECKDDADLCSKGSGYIRKDNPLYDFIMNCSNPNTGDYVFNSGSCVTVKAGSTDSANVNCSGKGQNTTNTSTDEETGEETTSSGGKVCDEAADGEFEDSEVPDLQHPESMEAISVFLIDYQILQSINGEDDAEGESQNSSNDLVGDKSPPLPKGDYNANTYWKCDGSNHGAIDFPAPEGTPIYAVADGTVTLSGPNSGWGNYVRIQHEGNIATGYAHMVEMPMVKVGDTVKAGQQIGKVGSTGHSTGNHLHFELYENGADDYSSRADGEVVFAWLKKNNILPKDQESLNDGGIFCG